MLSDQRVDHRNTQRQRLQSVGLSASFLAPIALQAVSEGFGLNPESRAGRTTSGVLSAAGTGLAVGTLGGGPVLGAVVGGFFALKAVLDNTTKSFEEIAKTIDEENNKRQEQANNIGAANQALGTFVDLIHNGGDLKTLTRSRGQVTSLLQQAPADIRSKLAFVAAHPTSSNYEELQDVIAKRAQLDATRSQVGEATKRFTLTQDKTQGINSFLNTPFGEIDIGGIAGNQRQVNQALDPSQEGFDSIGSKFRRGLIRSLTGKFDPIKGVVGGVENLDDLQKNQAVPDTKDVLSNIESLKSITIPEDVLKNTDFTKKIKDLTTGGDYKKAFENFLIKDLKIEEKEAAAYINILKGGDDLTNRQELRAFYSNKQTIQTLAKKAEDSAIKYQGSFKDFLNISDKILKDVAHNFNIDNLKDSGLRDLQLNRAKGLLQIGSSSLTPKRLENLEFVNTTQGLTNDHIKNVKGLLSDALGKLDIPREALDNPKVQIQLAKSTVDLTNNPQNIVSNAKDISEVIKSTPGIKNAEDHADKVQEGVKEFARLLHTENESYLIKYKDANQTHELKLSEIQFNSQKNFLGGDFTKLLNFDFSKTDAGLRGLGQLGRSQVVGGNRKLGSVQGDDLLDFTEFRQQKTFRSSGSSFDDFFHGGLRDFTSERQKTATRAASVTDYGKELQSLGLLEDEPALRKKFAKIGTEGGIAAGNNLINEEQRKARLYGQEDVVQALERQRQRLPGAERLKNAVDFQTGEVSQIDATKRQQQVGKLSSDEALLSLDPIKSNSAALLQNKGALLKLDKSLNELKEAFKEDKEAKEKLKEENEKSVTGGSRGAQGYIPNFNDFLKEARDIRAGVGGARPGDVPYFANIKGLGPAVVNSGESIVRNFMGTGKDAVLNRNMKRAAGGFFPNFANNDDEELREYERKQGIYSGKSFISNENLKKSFDSRYYPERPEFKASEKTELDKYRERQGIYSGKEASEHLKFYGIRAAQRVGDFFAAPFRDIQPTTQAQPATPVEKTFVTPPANLQKVKDFNSNEYPTSKLKEFSTQSEFEIRLDKTVPNEANAFQGNFLSDDARSGKFNLETNKFEGAIRVTDINATRRDKQAKAEGYKDFAQKNRYIQGGDLVQEGIDSGSIITQSKPYDSLESVKPITRAQLDREERIAFKNQQISKYQKYTGRENINLHIIPFHKQVEKLRNNLSLRPDGLNPLPSTSKKFNNNFPSDFSFSPEAEKQRDEFLHQSQILRGQNAGFGKGGGLRKLYNPKYKGGGLFEHLISPKLEILDHRQSPFSQFQKIQRGLRSRSFDFTAARGFIPNFAYDNERNQFYSVIDGRRVYTGSNSNPAGASAYGLSSRGLTTASLESSGGLGFGSYSSGGYDRKPLNNNNPFYSQGGENASANAIHLARKFGRSGATALLFRSALNIPDLEFNPGTYANGYIPGLSDAINRESNALRDRGIANPQNHIFVGNSQGILGVGNTIDEQDGIIHPNLGLQQGINRYKKAGLNPRNAGRIPNYAGNSSEDRLIAAMQALISKLGTLIENKNANPTSQSQNQSQKGTKHSGKFDVNVVVDASGSGKQNFTVEVQNEIKEAINVFRRELNERLNALEKKNGVLTSPPASSTLLRNSFV